MVEKKINEQELKLKYEIAAELGLFERVKRDGWKSLTAKETGRIGGLMTKRKKMMQFDKSQQI
jgi:small acid-soluble spore protein F (minor alpha/beta-type SASP)